LLPVPDKVEKHPQSKLSPRIRLIVIANIKTISSPLSKKDEPLTNIPAMRKEPATSSIQGRNRAGV